MKDSKNEILNFWFEETNPAIWFHVSEEFNARILERFQLTYDMAKDGLSNHWADDIDGALALCLVLTEFPRRMFRGTTKVYETDDKARLIAKKAISRGFDQLLPHEQRFFMYMPIEYSEDMADQKQNLALFKAMELENPLAYTVAKRKHDTLEKFGRFPERNAILGRDTTPEEQEYLEHIGTRN